MLIRERDGKAPHGDGHTLTPSPPPLRPLGRDLGPACTGTRVIFQAARSKSQTMQWAIWDLATEPQAGPNCCVFIINDDDHDKVIIIITL